MLGIYYISKKKTINKKIQTLNINYIKFNFIINEWIIPLYSHLMFQQTIKKDRDLKTSHIFLLVVTVYIPTTLRIKYISKDSN